MKFLCVFMIMALPGFVFGQDSNPKEIIPEQIRDLPKVEFNFRPKLSMQRAFKLMEKFIDKQNIDTSKYYLSSVTKIQYGSKENKIPVWFFAWMNENGALGDYLHIIVDMDGKVGQLPTM